MASTRTFSDMMRTTLAIALMSVAMPTAASGADTIVAFDGSTIRGEVLRLEEGRLVIRPADGQEAKPVALGDLTSVKLIPTRPDPERSGTQLLIDNDGFHGPTEKSGKIKLKQGLHSFTVLFFQGTQGATLSFQWEGPGIPKAEVPPNAIVKWMKNVNEVTPSSGVDEQGFRQPDEIGQTMPTVGYKLHEWSQNGLVSEVGDLRNLVLKRRGTTRKIGLDFPHTPTNFGAVFYGLIRAPRDGEYTFYVNSDDGSQLYIGRMPSISLPTIREAATTDWSVTLTEGGHLDVPLAAWNESGAELAFKIGGNDINLKVPHEHLRELWTREAADKKVTVDRSGEPTDSDTVYAKNADGQMQRVSGTVKGITDGSLNFQFQEQDRSIKLDRVVGIVMKQSPPENDPTKQRRVRILFDLVGPTQFVGHLVELTSGRAVVELPWGQSVSFSRNLIYRMSVLNGRVQSLQDLSPAEVVQTPFFDRMLTWQSGKSLTGGTLKIGEKTYQKGLCLHSRTRLTYDVDGEYERFQCDLGLQRPEGDAGNATVRITADGTELFVADEVTAAGPPHELDLDLAGKKQLTLEVDFGREMHIGDHVVFGNARLLRPELAP